MPDGPIDVSQAEEAATETADGGVDAGPTEADAGDAGGCVDADGGTRTDETIAFDAELLGPSGTGFRFCVRWTGPSDGYCFNVTTSASGANPGSIQILKQTALGLVTLGTTTDLPITMGTWHNYRLTIRGSCSVYLDAYLDGATTPTVGAMDDADPYPAGGLDMMTGDGVEMIDFRAAAHGG